jgi:V-type H+-transporting ATPase subunit a
VIFLMALFGYLVIVIFIKWYTDFAAEGTEAPSLITLLISMFLSPGTVLAPVFSGQVPLRRVPPPCRR